MEGAEHTPMNRPESTSSGKRSVLYKLKKSFHLLSLFSFFTNRWIQFNNHLSEERPLTGSGLPGWWGEVLSLLENLEPHHCEYVNKVTGTRILTSCRWDPQSSLYEMLMCEKCWLLGSSAQVLERKQWSGFKRISVLVLGVSQGYSETRLTASSA